MDGNGVLPFVAALSLMLLRLLGLDHEKDLVEAFCQIEIGALAITR